MTMPFLNYTESSPNFEKFKKYPKNFNMISFWVFLVSIFIYISKFYVFNFSPSTLLCTPKFWFIISNTLILIIAADFSASKNYHDFYDEYLKNSTRANNVSSFEIQYLKTDEKKDMLKFRKKEVYEGPREKIIGMVENKLPETKEKDDKLAGKKSENCEKKKREVIMISNMINPEVKIEASEVIKKKEAKYVRRNSEKSNILAENKEKMVLRKTMAERYDHTEEPRLEENEFSRMSDEQLNRRVEEFIRRCRSGFKQLAATDHKNME